MPRRRAASMRFVPASTSISLPSIVSFISTLGGGAGKAGARASRLPRAGSWRAQGLELGAEFFDVGDVGADGAVVERADRGTAAALGDVEDGVEVVLAAVALDDAVHHLF